MSETIRIGILFGSAAFVANIVLVIVAIYKLGRAVEKFEMVGTVQSNEISQLKTAVNGISELITKLALQNQRMDTLSDRLNRQEKLTDDLRRGEGWILPIDLDRFKARPAS